MPLVVVFADLDCFQVYTYLFRLGKLVGTC
jgi:hypothetical protein